MSPMVNSVNITEACAKALVVIASSPCKLDEFDPRVPRTLARNGLAEIDEAAGKVRISAHGLATLKAINAKDAKAGAPAESKNGIRTRERRSTTDAPTKTSRAAAESPRRDSRERPAPKPKSPPPTGVVDFDALRAEIVAHYEADLAACDRMREIAARVKRTA